jgi:hypothetical protein
MAVGAVRDRGAQPQNGAAEPRETIHVSDRGAARRHGCAADRSPGENRILNTRPETSAESDKIRQPLGGHCRTASVRRPAPMHTELLRLARTPPQTAALSCGSSRESDETACRLFPFDSPPRGRMPARRKACCVLPSVSGREAVASRPSPALRPVRVPRRCRRSASRRSTAAVDCSLSAGTPPALRLARARGPAFRCGPSGWRGSRPSGMPTIGPR